MTIRLHFLVEGQTEFNFVNRILRHSIEKTSLSVSVSKLTTKRDEKLGRKFSGGASTYEKLKKELSLFLKDSSIEFRLTTMIDLYKFPSGFPTFDEMKKTPQARVKKMQETLYADFNDHRFIPFIQLHEYEAILFSNPQKFSEIYENVSNGIKNLIGIAATQHPEEINDGEHTAPSKRIIKEIPKYEFEKSSTGVNVAIHIGLEEIRKKCPHFNEWVAKLENL